MEIQPHNRTVLCVIPESKSGLPFAADFWSESRPDKVFLLQPKSDIQRS